MVIPTLKTCHFEASEDFMTKFKSIALHIMSKHFELECMQEKALILSLKTQKLHRFLLGPIFPALLISNFQPFITQITQGPQSSAQLGK